MPAISVVIPTYNRVKYLPAALASVFDQTYTDYEVIVVDDGSTDDTRAVLQPWIEAGHLRYHHQVQSGVSAARNQGIELAQGRYIAFLDSDDMFEPTKLEKQMAVFERHPDLGFVHCHFMKFDDQGHHLGLRNTSRFQGQVYPNILQEWDLLMATPCMLMRKTVLEEVGGYDVAMTWAEDLDLWRRISLRYPIDLVPEVLVRVRVHAESASQQRAQAVPHFRRYLDKAFAEDPTLGSAFRRRCYATLYAQMGKNLLGEGDAPSMKLARQLARQSIQAQPFQLSAYLVTLASRLGPGLRAALAGGLRRLRYRR